MVPGERKTAAQPSPPRPTLGLAARPRRLGGGGGGGGERAERRGPWAGTLPLPPGSPAGLQRGPPGNLALPRPGARGAQRAGGGSPGGDDEGSGRQAGLPALTLPQPLAPGWATECWRRRLPRGQWWYLPASGESPGPGAPFSLPPRTLPRSALPLSPRRARAAPHPGIAAPKAGAAP